MAAAATNQIYRVILRGTLCGQQIQTLFDYRISSLVGLWDVTDIYNDIASDILAAGKLVEKYMDCVPSNMTVADALIQCIAPQRIRGGVALVNLPGNRGFADTANVQASVERFGELATRRAVGAVHPPVSTAGTDLAIGFVTAAQFAALTALGTQMTASIAGLVTGAILDPVIYNRSFIPNYTQVTGAVAKNTVRTMHRRTVGLGK